MVRGKTLPQLSALLLVLMTASLLQAYENDGRDEEAEQGSAYWYAKAQADLDVAMNRPINTDVAWNVILFVGDGMGPSIVTAGRIFKGQELGFSGEEGFLTFDRLPNIGLLKTYNVNKQVPDSAGTATAYLTGVKANYNTVGVTAAVKRGDCQASLVPENRAYSIAKWAQDMGMGTGLVTTARITHATPSAVYAGSSNRDWECDAKMNEEDDPSVLDCKDLARQLVEDSPGRDFKVVFGGGRQPMGAQFDNSSSSTCKREDGRNLVQEWLDYNEGQGHSTAYVTNHHELDNVDMDTEHIMGLFSESHMDYERNRDQGEYGQPSIAQMTAAAISRLEKEMFGYLLVVEGARIDHALHDGKAQISMEEIYQFDEAVQTALDMVDLETTLVIVTADHSHGMTINGYPPRGNDILGTTAYDGMPDNMEYTTLMFTTGPGYQYDWDGEKVVRKNVTGVDTRDSDFMFPAGVPTLEGWGTHGGEDVAVYAAGPGAHLFHRVHEQNYVAHVIGHSARIGPYHG